MDPIVRRAEAIERSSRLAVTISSVALAIFIMFIAVYFLCP